MLDAGPFGWLDLLVFLTFMGAFGLGVGGAQVALTRWRVPRRPAEDIVVGAALVDASAERRWAKGLRAKRRAAQRIPH